MTNSQAAGSHNSCHYVPVCIHGSRCNGEITMYLPGLGAGRQVMLSWDEARAEGHAGE